MPIRDNCVGSSVDYFSGLPGSGKSSISQELARRTHWAYLRIDTLEQGLRDECNFKVEGEGYAIAFRLAADNLRAANSVIADSCNPLQLTRDLWHRTATVSGYSFIDVEVVCSDIDEHRRRVEERINDVPGLIPPTWQQVLDREYHPWTSNRIVIDTAGRALTKSADQLMEQLQAR